MLLRLCRRPARAVVVLTLVLGTVSLCAPAAASEPAHVQYHDPVDAPLLDRFRPPATPFGAGNRGIDYATTTGAEVRASGPGLVTFAGRIGPSHHVVVLHADGLRTSYSFLAGTSVRRGDHVVGGDVLGAAGGPLHFGVRAGSEYLDPLTVLGAGPPRVHLVPVTEAALGSVAEERRGLIRSLGGALVGGLRVAGRAADAGVEWARDAAGRVGHELAARAQATAADVAVLLHYVRETSEVVRFVRVVRAMLRWAHTECTPAGVTPPQVRERRIAVLVGGLGSESGKAAVLGLDTAGLGYAPADVVQFSYRGGVAPGQGGLAGVATSTYTADDTLVDLAESATRLRQTLAEIRHHHPGVPVDLLAHSQGGLVVRLALGGSADHLDPRLPPIRTLITMGTPHRGADPATAADGLDGSFAGTALLSLVDLLTGVVGPSTVQMSETSRVMRGLRGRRLPRGAHVVSIGASGDLVVAGPNTRLDGAHNVVVGLDGVGAHGALPASAAVQREIALARAGLPPTCQSFLSALDRAVTGEMVSLASDRTGLALNVVARWADRGFPSLAIPRT